MDFNDDAAPSFDLYDETPGDEGTSPDGGDNRTFIIVAAALGGLVLLTLVCMAVYLVRGGTSGRQAQMAEVATINAQNTQVAEALQLTQLAQAWTPTFTATSIPVTATSTPTPVVAMPTDTATPTQPASSPTPDPRQATIDALATISALTKTPAASGSLTGTPSATGMPNTGFADDVGLTGLAVGALALLLVIFVARRLRTA
ncbi:MAG: hypothetical protein Fur0018_05150 [Anaerolineales bacterium]